MAPLRGRGAVLAALIALIACKAPSSGPTSPARSPTEPNGKIVGEYAVAYDGKGELTVEASFDRIGELLAVENGADRFIRDLEVAPGGGATAAKWTRGGRSDRFFVAAPCAAGPCRIRYRYALREAAKKLDDLDVASEEGPVIEAPPSTWLLAPARPDGASRIRFRVSAANGTAFVTGVFRSREAKDAWDMALADLWTAPYSAFGPLRVRTIQAGTTQARVDIAIAPGTLTLTDDELVSWASNGARAIASYLGRFPMSEALILLMPSRGRWVGEGKTLSGGGGAIFMRVGEKAPLSALSEDWVLVHEMTHLAFPSVAREHDWAEEGLATYVEPFARAREGLMTAEDAWHGLVEGLPNGLPASGDRGLDRTPTWGRTYWGGALFYLLADIEIRKRTKNERGLEHALRGILAAGGNNAYRWALADAFDAGDKATGVPVLRELHEAMGTSPHPVDLEGLWRDLGIVRAGKTVRLDDAAPHAAIRRAITTAD